MTAYYNEIDPYASQWLRNLITAGHIAPGDVDERSIEDVCPDDLRGYTQCHFFAGIGVWSHALRRIGWADDQPIWTASCPCQPFSAAGQGFGFADERHLWPALYHLIINLRPIRIVGEQVASADGIAWLDLIQSDLEGADYAPRAVPFPGASVGAPHIRDRTYWVADDDLSERPGGIGGARATRQPGGRLENPGAAAGLRLVGGLGDTGVHGYASDSIGRTVGASQIGGGLQQPKGPGPSVWDQHDWIFCRDGRWRPVEPGTFPLAHGSPSRMGRLRAYGNAIIADAAVAFLKAVDDSVSGS